MKLIAVTFGFLFSINSFAYTVAKIPNKPCALEAVGAVLVKQANTLARSLTKKQIEAGETTLEVLPPSEITWSPNESQGDNYKIVLGNENDATEYLVETDIYDAATCKGHVKVSLISEP